MRKETGHQVIQLKDGESIMVGTTKVTVNLGDYMGSVKLYIQADKDIKVERVK